MNKFIFLDVDEVRLTVENINKAIKILNND